MTLIRYRGRVAGLLDATGYQLTPDLTNRPDNDPELRRLIEVCEWALELRRVTGCAPGCLPGDRPAGGDAGPR